MENGKIYDLLVVGNGVAAQVFLWNLFEDRKRQDFSVAQVACEKLAPACTLRSSATVSLNGISEDVSPLGNEMREAYFLFEDFYKNHRPLGVQLVDRQVVATNENDEKKLIRRYKKINEVRSSLLASDKNYQGVVYPSYLIGNDEYLNWLTIKNKENLDSFNYFIKNIIKKDNSYFELETSCKKKIKAKKILLACGAFAKIYHNFFRDLTGEEKESKNEIKAGSYLERELDLGLDSFYLSLDSHNILYRKESSKRILQIGSHSVLGAYETPPLTELNIILKKCQMHVSFDLGEIKDYKIITGLRHKAPKRMIECRESIVTPGIFHLNGLYKNGFSMSFLGAKRMFDLIT